MINRSLKPEPSKEISFELPEIKEYTLENNLRVLFVQKNNLPIAQLSLVTEAGSKFDGIGQKGISNLTAQLLDEGAGNYNALQLDEEFDLLGTAFSTSVNDDNVYLNLLSLEENFDRSLELFKLVVTEPNFKDDDFSREQKKLIAKLIQSKSQPSSIANKSFNKIVFQGNPYSFPTSGLESDVATIKNNDIKAFYKDHYSPTNSYLIVVGNMNEEKLIAQLNESFKNWNSTTNSDIEITTPPKQKTKIFVSHKNDSQQTEIRIGHLSKSRKSEDYFAKLVMNTILGGQFSSRINLNLREDKGYTYGAHSGFSYNKLMSHFSVSTSVENKFTKNSVDEIIKELEGIKISISDEEINFAKSYLIKRFPAMFETYNSISRNMVSLVVHDLPFDYFNNYIKNLSAVTKSDVENAASNNVHPENCSIILVGDEEFIRTQFVDSNFEIESVSI